MKIRKVFTLTTFIGAAVACSIVTSSYPIAIWAVAFGVSQRKRLIQAQQQHMCPLAQAAATREREVKRGVDQNYHKDRRAHITN